MIIVCATINDLCVTTGIRSHIQSRISIRSIWSAIRIYMEMILKFLEFYEMRLGI